ncbi:MAG TPA: ABC transporter substrate-binding protein [Streptosporangiaceae bacterium]|jgi:peptide/nickel transport system substrate-binding protein|nr:ABC transporter substrate-binding protein [Streptosporangiaceae bacterium]
MAVAILAASSLAACSSTSSTGGTSSTSSTPSANSAGKPVFGGTLRWVASGDVDHLDPMSAYYTATGILERAYTRQLITYPSSNNYTTGTTIAADMATVVPTMANGGLSSDGLTYTFHLRSGVMWNTTPPRAVVAGDFVRALKRFCNPVLGVGNPTYYTSTIAGMASYCAAYAKLPSTSTAAQLAAFQNSHTISGVSAPDASTLVIKLSQPASDFLNIMAMTFVSAAPVEWDQYLPDSAAFRQHVYSDGPYQISQYTAGKTITLTRNPEWSQSTDPIRHQYVASMVVTEGTNDPGQALQDLQAGSGDLMWDLPVPTNQIPALEASKNPDFTIWSGHISNPYLVFNTLAGPTKNLKVRQAIEYAIDKVNIAKIYGGTTLNPPITTAIPPGNIGYTDYNLYPTPGNNGDPAKCKSMLTAAGFPNGITLTDAYRNAGNHPAVFQSVQADLKACGITVVGSPQQQGNYYAYLENPANTKAGKWDISEPGWVPDWFGNNGRTTMQPLFQTPCVNPTTNYGCYTSTAASDLINKALTATSLSAAATFWHEADMQVMSDAVIVPFTNQNTPAYHSSRVQDAVWSWTNQLYDPTQLWLSPNTP